MTANPETIGDAGDSAEEQEIIESAKAKVDSLGEEVITTSGTKNEINNRFSEFFKKLKNMWNEFKQGHIGNAISILFGSTKKDETNKSTTEKETPQETSNAGETTTNSNNNGNTETEGNETEDTNKVSEDVEEEPKDSDLVDIKKYISNIKYDLKYASSDNNFGLKIYPDGESNLKLEYEAVKKLSKAQEILKEQGYQLKIWDSYRPDDAQFKLWDNYKGPASTKRANVAEPKRENGKKVGSSHHGSGKAIDLTLLDSNGNEVEMPTEFDDFSGNAKWDKISGKKGEKYKNAYILRRAMEKAGFYTISSEWRHYQTDIGRSTLNHLETEELSERGIIF